ncbi:hypothetical protein QQX98_008612 [Neonectria punicea]|uniref:Uncharacterized protein n=1 Tax=Neonectria punicea TaxID=979145 RepID=A0ABR1GUQ4_9HYPO
MAAQHSSRSKPLEHQRYLTLAEHHYELAVRDATVNLASLTWDNAQPMYASMEATRLIDSYKTTFGTEAEPIAYNGGKIQDVMGWLYRMDTEFIAQLETGKPIPLILLAYFAVLLKSLESFWFMEGWAKHLLREVNELLGPQHKRWLAWPTSQILN